LIFVDTGVWVAMTRLFTAAFLGFLATVSVSPVLGCKCVGYNSVCERFASADVVFVGRVESRRPDFDPYDPAFTRKLQELFPGVSLDDLDLNSSETLAKIKLFYAEILTEPERSAVTKAASVAELEALLDRSFGDGQRVTLTVDQAYKGVGRDLRSIDVWTDFLSDCAVQFRKGETYVVYAWNDRGRLKTGRCSRTQRLSEAGDDLVYLHFVQSGGPDTGRIWGFASGDERAPHVPRIFDSMPLPMSDLNVQLHSSQRVLEAWTDQKGQYVFDGLPAGDYEVAIENQSRKVHLGPKACESEWFYVPRTSQLSK
jgi:hypothetical protein